MHVSVACRLMFGVLTVVALCKSKHALGQYGPGSSLPGQAAGRRNPQTISGSPSPSTDSAGAGSSIDISGKVLNARNQQPVARALVQFGSRAVLTDHDGVFRLPDVPSNPGALYSAMVSKPGFYASNDGEGGIPQTFSYPVASAIELLLYPEAILSGNVADAFGEGLVHLSVVARRSVFDENGHHWLPAGQAQTGNDGTFRLSLPSGAYVISVSPRGRPQSAKEIVLPLSVPAITSSLAEAIHLSAGEEVHLALRAETRKSYQVTIGYEADGGGAFPTLSARTANGVVLPLSPIPSRGDNRSELRVALPSGTYTLAGSMQNSEGLSEAQAQITVTDHDLTGITLRFAHAPSLPVVVETDSSATSDNVKVPDAMQLGLSLQAAAETPDGNEQMYRVTPRRNVAPDFSVPEGAYRLRAASTGQWFIVSATCGGVDLLAQDLPVSAGLNGTELRVRLSNKTASLSGSVTMDGVPAAAWVYLLATAPSATPVLILRSGPDGSFFRPYLASGSYRAIALSRKIAADFQSPATLNLFLDRLQSLSVSAGEQRRLNLVAVPERELPQ